MSVYCTCGLVAGHAGGHGRGVSATIRRVAVVLAALVVVVVGAWLIQSPPSPDEGFPFTTMSCPGGVPAPCLDNTVSAVQVESWLREHGREWAR